MEVTSWYGLRSFDANSTRRARETGIPLVQRLSGQSNVTAAWEAWLVSVLQLGQSLPPSGGMVGPFAFDAGGWWRECVFVVSRRRPSGGGLSQNGWGGGCYCVFPHCPQGWVGGRVSTPKCPSGTESDPDCWKGARSQSGSKGAREQGSQGHEARKRSVRRQWWDRGRPWPPWPWPWGCNPGCASNRAAPRVILAFRGEVRRLTTLSSSEQATGGNVSSTAGPRGMWERKGVEQKMADSFGLFRITPRLRP